MKTHAGVCQGPWDASNDYTDAGVIKVNKCSIIRGTANSSAAKEEDKVHWEEEEGDGGNDG